MLIAQSRKAGLLDNQEEVLLRRVFVFGEKTAQHVMTPRTEIVGVSCDITLEQLREKVAGERFTRLPVYDGTLANILGVAHIKDVLAQLSKRRSGESFSMLNILRPALAVPKTTSILKLMAQMQNRQSHLAVVIDEYGETAGIVTLEDILEEIVGEVQDEFDIPEEGVRPDVEMLAEGVYSVDGRMSVSAFTERFGVEFGNVRSETVAGYALETLGRIPKVGESFLLEAYRFRVESMDHLRIARLRVEQIKHDAAMPDRFAQVTSRTKEKRGMH